MLVLAGSGGSSGQRCRAWRHGLQHRLCDRYGLSVTARHYPAGASSASASGEPAGSSGGPLGPDW